jgi:3-hydroxyacyl-CoA dehydrogenase/enoyl-CoA hydratase/3-hydroxybutyryl-CoA epimerase
MHFFNPVHKMPLIEVIRGEKTNDRAAATIFSLSKKMGKTPIVVKDGPGFLVNRLLMPYLNEACFTVADGASVEFIDKACLKFGMPMGPLHLIDEIGIDVAEKVAKILGQAFGVRAEAAPMMHKVVEAKKLGKKNGTGFYIYDSSGKKLHADKNLYQIIGLPSPKNPFTEEEIVNRVLFPMVNEAALCLEEGIVTTPEAVDLGMIMGTGFPPFRGGLLRWADSVGIAKIVDDLEVMSTKFGPRFKPSNPLRNMAKTNRTFYK